MRRCVLYMWLGLLLAGLAGADRPRDPWVFRCVLDKHPRMVVIALDEHLWVAYDATDCTLYKAWDGDVKFQGAVYNAVHGPQPVVRGTTLMEKIDGATWHLTKKGEGLETMRDLKAVWKGYRLEGDEVYLQFELEGPDGESVIVHESPEVSFNDEGLPILRRTIRTENVPDDWNVSLSWDTRQVSGHLVMYAVGEESAFRGQGLTNADERNVSRQHFFLKSNDVTIISVVFAEMPGGGSR